MSVGAGLSDRALLWGIAATQVIGWGAMYTSFPLLVAPMEAELGWSRVLLNTGFTAGLLASGLAAVPAGKWVVGRSGAWMDGWMDGRTHACGRIFIVGGGPAIAWRPSINQPPLSPPPPNTQPTHLPKRPSPNNHEGVKVVRRQPARLLPPVLRLHALQLLPVVRALPLVQVQPRLFFGVSIGVVG